MWGLCVVWWLGLQIRVVNWLPLVDRLGSPGVAVRVTSYLFVIVFPSALKPDSKASKPKPPCLSAFQNTNWNVSLTGIFSIKEFYNFAFKIVQFPLSPSSHRLPT